MSRTRHVEPPPGLFARVRGLGRRTVAGLAAFLLAVTVLPALLATGQARAADGQGFNLNASDLRFILNQIKIAERHASTATADNPCGTLLGTGVDQIPNQNAQGAELPWGLRTVDGTCNNLKPGQDEWGAAGRLFPRRAPANFRTAEATPPGFPTGNGSPTSYANRTGFVYDSQPRVASNLIVDQTTSNPAAVAAAGEATADGSGTLPIPNVAPDVGLSAPFNSLFTLFGQFFDHGLDLVGKKGGTVFVPLKADDPLIAGPDGILGNTDDLPAHLRFMVLTRATTATGPDGLPNTADDAEATNKTSPYVDQSQTYTSHPSHQAFLREYTAGTAGEPTSTGRILTGPGGGLATWGAVKTQAAERLGITLTDTDVFDVPLLATDAYGTLDLSDAGRVQIVTATGLVPAGSPGAPVALPSDTVRTGHSFLDDIAHHAVPGTYDIDGNPATPTDRAPQTPDTDPGTTDDRDRTTYDDEMLAAHFVAGDGRINENIGLTAVHHVFHAEHNRLVGNIQELLTAQGQTVLDQWQTTAGPAGWDYGERLFQAARFVTEMEYQHLAFEEFARKVQPMVNVFAGYDTSIDAAISAEFAHAVYRFGHSMLTETVARRSATGTPDDIPLLDAFLNPPAFYEDGRTPDQAVGDIARGMTDQVGNEIDEFVTEALRNNLLGLPLDLATLNMARARETGVPTLNEARRKFFALTNGNSALAPYENWIDFGLGLRHHASLVNFVAAYGTHPAIVGATTLAEKRRIAALVVAGDPNNPDTPAGSVEFMQGTGGLEDVDLWVGGLAEKQAPFGGLLGSTFNFIFETEMEDLQDGDRFYYLSRTAGLNLLVQLEGNSFAELISRNSDAENLPADVFSRPDLTFDLRVQPATGAIVDDPATAYDERTLLTRMADGTIRYSGALHVLFVGSAAADKVRSSEGDDTLRGNEQNDRLEGGAGNDQFVGGSGEDVLTDSFGDDVLKGGDGNDAMASGPGFDLNQGGLGDDFVVGGSDPTETFGGPGDDLVYGGDSADTVFGDDGDDWLEGGGQADLVQGDNGAPFQDDPNTPGHDVLNGLGGQDDYDSEGGDDIMVAGPGIERNEGMLGFDWVTHKNDPQAADDDLDLSGLLPPSVDALRDRFDLVEAVSGWDHDDTIRGSSSVADDMVDHSLTAAGVARIEGLATVLPGAATTFTGGDILIGGRGSDVIEGRAGDDLIDGDVWLDVQLEAPNPAVAGSVQRVDGMSALQADVFAGRINPGDIAIVRSIVAAPGTGFTDTAVFSGLRAEYDVTVNADGTTTVVHARGAATDGTDTLRGIEELRFADTGNAVAPGAPTGVTAVAGNAQATVTFTAPASDGGSPIIEYEVDVLAGTTLVRTVEVLAPATSTVVTGLTNGTAYTFVVRAVNAVGVSADSAPSVAVTPRAPTVPAAPTGVTATAGNASATVAWTPPTNTGGSAITSYSVQVRNAAGTVLRTVTGVPATATSTVVTGLTNGTAYNFRVRAVNAVGNGTLSTASNSVTPTAGTTTNPAPTVTARTPAVNAVSVAAGANITATFSEAVQGVTTTTFAVRPAATPTAAPIAGTVTQNGTTNQWILNPTANLAADTRYTVTLTGGATAIRDSQGAALTTTSWSFTTGPAPTLTARSPGVNATAVGRTANVTATFSENVQAVSGTTFTLRNPAGTLITAVVSRNGTTNQWILNPGVTLAANTVYRVNLVGGANGIKDLAGNPLANITWTFTTGA